MLNVRRSFFFLFVLMCAASCALAYPVAYTINVTFVEVPGASDPLGLGAQSPPVTATITTTLESVAAPGANYPATVIVSSQQLSALDGTYTGNVAITTAGHLTATFSGTVGSFTANVVLPGVTFPSAVPLPFGSVNISSPASTANYDTLGVSGEVGITGSVVATGLSAAPSSISASYNGSTAPAPQTITVNDSTGASAFTATVGNASATFLTIAPASGTTPSPVTLTFSTTVPPGTYTADVLLNTTADASGAPLSIPVTYTVSSSSTPLLQLSSVAPFTFYTPSSTTTLSAPLTVSVPSGGSNGSFTASVATGSAYFSVSPTAGNTPATLTVTANATGLAAGTYSGTVVVTVPGYPAATANLSLTVSSSSTGGGGSTSSITLSPSSLTLDVAAGSFSTDLARVQVTTPTPVAFTVTGYNFYLPVSPLSGTTNAAIEIGVNATALANGTYPDNLTITAGGKSVILPVTVNVGPLNDITLNTYAVTFTSPSPTGLSQTISVTSDTATQFAYTLTPSAPWITVTPASGTSPSTFTVTVNPAGRPAGLSTGTVTIASPSVRNSPQVLHVALNVSQAVATPLTVTPSVILFTAAPGGGAPPTQTVQLASATPTPAYVVTAVGSPWLTASLDAATGVVTLTADPTGLAAGTYPGSIKITGTGLSNSPDYLPVSLVVGSSAVVAAPVALNFGGTASATQTIAVAPAAAGATLTAASDSPWLTVTQPAPDVTVTANPSGLAVGTYNGNITLTSTAGAVSAQAVVPVTLTVGTPATPTLAAVTSAISYIAGAPAAPGALMALFGNNLTSGTSGGNTVQTASNAFGSLLNGVEVFADGIPCPILYASPSQVNVILPFGLAGQTTADIYLNAYGVNSSVLAIPIAPTAPALFSATANGTGEGAILNPDLSFNSATNPAPAGSEIALFGGGAGVTAPFASDGQIIPTSTPFPTLAAGVTATVAGQTAAVDYSGDAPGLVAGVLQVNITIPAGTPSGAQPVVVNIGGVNSQAGLTVFVQ